MVAVVVAFAFAAAAALVVARPYHPCRNSNENSANPTQYTLGTTPSTPLPWNDWNFIASTDTHGWQAGHGTDDDGQYSADWAGNDQNMKISFVLMMNIICIIFFFQTLPYL